MTTGQAVRPFLFAGAICAIGIVLAVQACSLPGRGRGPGGKFRRCARASGAGQMSVKAGSITCKWDGRTGSCSGGDESSLDLCIFAGVSGTDRTSRNVEEFVSTCVAGGPDAVVVLGDTGADKDRIEGTIARAAAAGVPVLVLPGSGESYGEYLDAIEASRDRGVAVVDLSRVRILAWAGAAIVSLPGVRNPWYLRHPGEGCGWDEDDLDDLGDLIVEAGKKGRVVLLGGWPPAGSGSVGIDTSREGSHVGDAALARLLRDGRVGFGAFGAIYEAGGVGIDPASGEPLAQGKWHSALHINPGSVEAVPWQGEGGGGFSVGEAAVMQVGPKGGRYFVWRVR